MFDAICGKCKNRCMFPSLGISIIDETSILITCPICKAKGRYRLDKFKRNDYGFGN